MSKTARTSNKVKMRAFTAHRNVIIKQLVTQKKSEKAAPEKHIWQPHMVPYTKCCSYHHRHHHYVISTYMHQWSTVKRSGHGKNGHGKIGNR